MQAADISRLSNISPATHTVRKTAASDSKNLGTKEEKNNSKHLAHRWDVPYEIISFQML